MNGLKKTVDTKKLFRVCMFSMLTAISLYICILIFSLAGFLDLKRIPEMLASAQICHAIWLTLATATLSSSAALIAGIPAAYVLSRYRFPGHDFIDTLLDLPIVLSPAAVGTGILLLFQTAPGRWFSSSVLQVVFSPAGIIIAQFTIVSALAIRLLKASFEEISPRYGNVARVLGCSPGRAFLLVDLPMARRGIVSAFILTWARAVGEFGATVTVAGATAFKTETLPTSMYLYMSMLNLSHAAFIMALMVCISFAVLLVSRQVLRWKVLP